MPTFLSSGKYKRKAKQNAKRMKIILKMLAYLANLLSDAPCANVILLFLAPLHRKLKLCIISWREIDQSPPLTFLYFLAILHLSFSVPIHNSKRLRIYSIRKLQCSKRTNRIKTILISSNK